MSIEFDFPEPPGGKSTLQSAISRIKENMEQLAGEKIDYATALHGVMTIWGDIYAKPDLRIKIENGLREKRLKMRTSFEMDMSKGDPVRKRYDPTLWMRNIPPELTKNPSLYVSDKCKSLLTFLESLDSQK